MSGIKFKFKLKDPKVIKAKVNREVRDLLNEFFAEGIKAFIVGALRELSPTIYGGMDTGMSAASLIPLARKVGVEDMVVSYIISNRKKASKKGSTVLRGEYRPGGIRNIAAGIQAGKRADKIKWATLNSKDMELKYSIKVYQMKFHEKHTLVLVAVLQ